MNDIKLGFEVGETCNRDGCKGIIEERDVSELSCSCHINPPCSKCSDPKECCPECDWDVRDEPVEVPKNPGKQLNVPYFKTHWERLEEFYAMENVDKVHWSHQSHTHFSMIKEGVYPQDMSRSDLLEEVKGTFGGRFVYCRDGRFKYIAYTD